MTSFTVWRSADEDVVTRASAVLINAEREKALETSVASDTPSYDPLGLNTGGEGAITGTVVCAAVIAYGVDKASSTLQLSVAIAATVTVYWMAHLHAAAVGNSLSYGHHPSLALRHALAETVPLAAASIVPLGILLLTRLAGASLSASAWIALLATIGLLALYSYIGGVRAGLTVPGRIISAAVGAGLGILVALLKVALH